MLSLIAIGLVCWFWLHHSDAPIRMSLVLIPLLPAVVIGASTRSPFGDAELSVSHPLPPLRSGHLGGLLLLAALVLTLVASTWEAESIGWELSRNLAGYTGLAFIGARILGSGIGWVVPLGYVTVAALLDHTSRWAWATTLPTNRWSLFVAIALLTVGSLLIASSGAPVPADDVP